LFLPYLITLLLKLLRERRIVLGNEKIGRPKPCFKEEGPGHGGRTGESFNVMSTGQLSNTLGGTVQEQKSPSILQGQTEGERIPASESAAWKPVFFEESQGESVRERFA